MFVWLVVLTLLKEIARKHKSTSSKRRVNVLFITCLPEYLAKLGKLIKHIYCFEYVNVRLSTGFGSEKYS